MTILSSLCHNSACIKPILKQLLFLYFYVNFVCTNLEKLRGVKERFIFVSTRVIIYADTLINLIGTSSHPTEGVI